MKSLHFFAFALVFRDEVVGRSFRLHSPPPPSFSVMVSQEEAEIINSSGVTALLAGGELKENDAENLILQDLPVKPTVVAKLGGDMLLPPFPSIDRTGPASSIRMVTKPQVILSAAKALDLGAEVSKNANVIRDYLLDENAAIESPKGLVAEPAKLLAPSAFGPGDKDNGEVEAGATSKEADVFDILNSTKRVSRIGFGRLEGFFRGPAAEAEAKVEGSEAGGESIVSEQLVESGEPELAVGNNSAVTTVGSSVSVAGGAGLAQVPNAVAANSEDNNDIIGLLAREEDISLDGKSNNTGEKAVLAVNPLVGFEVQVPTHSVIAKQPPSVEDKLEMSIHGNVQDEEVDLNQPPGSLILEDEQKDQESATFTVATASTPSTHGRIMLGSAGAVALIGSGLACCHRRRRQQQSPYEAFAHHRGITPKTGLMGRLFGGSKAKEPPRQYLPVN